MGDTTPTLLEAEAVDDDVHFFRRLGEVLLRHEPGGQASKQLVIATARHCGWCLVSNRADIFVAETAKLLEASRKGEEGRELPSIDSRAVCQLRYSLAGIQSISIDKEEALVALASSSQVLVHSLQQLVAGSTKPISIWKLPSNHHVQQFMWGSNASSPAQPPTGYVLTDSGQLLEGRLGGKLMPVPHVHANASCAAVAPNGQLIALGAADGVTVQALARPSEFYASIATQELDGAEEGTQLEVTSLHWISSRALLVGCHLVLGDAKQDHAPMTVLQWDSWEQDPTNLRTVDFFAFNIDPEAGNVDRPGTLAGLEAVSLPSWGLTITAHRKANDDHIQLIGMPPAAASAQSLDVTGEFTAIRIPAGPDDADNYVTGLAVDLTSTQIPVPHPNPEKADVAACPVLIVATSDGVLRLFSLGSTNEADGGLVQPKQAVPEPAYLNSLPSQGEQQSGEAEEQDFAALTQLPSDDDELEDSTRSPSISPGSPSSVSSTAAIGRSRPVHQRGASSASASSDEVQSRMTPEPSESAATPQRRDGPDLEQAALSTPLGAADDSFDESSSVGESPGVTGAAADLGSDAESSGKGSTQAAGSQAEPALQADSSTAIRGFPDPQRTASMLRSTPAQVPATPNPFASLTAAAPSAPFASQASTSPFSAPNSNSFASWASSHTPAAPAIPAASTPGPAPSMQRAGSIMASTPREAAARAAQARAASLRTPAMATATSASTPAPAPALTPTATPTPADAATPHLSAASTQEPSRQAIIPQPAAQHSSQPPATSRASLSAEASRLPAAPSSRQPHPRAQPEADAHDAESSAPDDKASSRRQAQKASHESQVKRPAPQLQDGAQQVADMEADFLKSLHETRILEAQLLDTLPKEDLAEQMRGEEQRTKELAADIKHLQGKIGEGKQTFSRLFDIWTEDCSTMAALLLFKPDATVAKASSQDSCLEPGLAAMIDHVEATVDTLTRHASDLRACLEALEDQSKAIASKPMSAKEVHGVINAQSEAARSLLSRIQGLWDRLGEVGGFPYIPTSSTGSQSSGSKRTALPNQNGADLPWSDAQSPWKAVKRTPLAERQHSSSPLALPASPHTPADGSAAEKTSRRQSPWQRANAKDVQRLILAKVAGRDGGVRVTQVGSNGEVHPQRSSTPSLSLEHPRTDLHEDTASSAQSRPPAAPSLLQPSTTSAGAAAVSRLTPTAPQARTAPSAPSQQPPTSRILFSSQPPVPMSAQVLAAQAVRIPGAAVPQRTPTAPTAPGGQPPVPTRAQVQAAQAVSIPGAKQGPQPSAPPPGTRTPVHTPTLPMPAGGQPPIPSRAQVQAAQAVSIPGAKSAQATGPPRPAQLQATPTAQRSQQPAAGGQPPVPTRAQVQEAQAVRLPDARPNAGAAVGVTKPKAASGGQPPVPPRSLVQAAQQQAIPGAASSAPAPVTTQAPSATNQPAVPTSGSFFSWAQPSQATAQLASFSPPTSTPSAPSSPLVVSTQIQQAATAGAASMPPLITPSSPPFTSSAAPSTSPASAVSAASGSSPIQTSPIPLNLTPAASLLAPQSTPASTNTFGSMLDLINTQNPSSAPASTPWATPTPAPTPTPSLAPAASQPPPATPVQQQPQQPSIFGTPASAAPSPFQAAGGNAFAAFASPQQPASSSAASMFARAGSVLPPSSGGLFGAPQPATPATPSSLGFGGIGLGSQPQTGIAAASSPFGRGLSFASPAPAAPSTPSAFGGAPQTPQQPTSIFTSNAASAPAFAGGGAFAGGFGQPGNAFSAAQAQPSQSSAFGGFGQPAMPGFGQAATPGFGQNAFAGFGQSAMPSQASPAAPSGAFGAAANQGGGFAAFAKPSSPGFGGSSTGGFGGMGQQQGGFGAFSGGGGGFGSFGTSAPSPPSSSPGTGAMWELRR